jgi:Flp pilus assembly protein TadG
MTVFVVPTMILVTFFVVFCGRAASAVIDVNSAAAAAARAAAEASTPAAAAAAATTAVAGNSAGMRWRCTPAVDTHAQHPGGQVTVTLDCQVSLSDLGLLGIGAARTLHGTATEPIDTYRATP